MINTVWDLGHRDLPEFVEITGTRHYEERELFFRSVLPKSFRVVVETAWTAQRIACLYDVDRERIIKIDLGSVDKIIPSSPSPAKVPPYFFYPAQFWPHKRHIMLLNAFAEVIRVHPEVKLVLTGADKGNLEHVKRKVSELGLSNYVSFLGFVSDDQVEELYKHALAVVFPSSLGPSNLPPIEAMRHGVPSLVSNAHHDPQLESPLVTIVEGQDPSLWARAMIGVLEGDHKRQVNPTGDHERGQPMSVLHETLESFREIRSEWR
jgi:glycosyltransferase involved in cell wall biosynthesis